MSIKTKSDQQTKRSVRATYRAALKEKLPIRIMGHRTKENMYPVFSASNFIGVLRPWLQTSK